MSEERDLFLARWSEFGCPKSIDKTTYVALIETSWARGFIAWLKSSGPRPGPITNRRLMSGKKLDPTKTFGHDFTICTESLFEELQDTFGGGPRIVRPLALPPDGTTPTVITRPVTLSFAVGDRTLKKVADPSWTLGPLKSALCRSLGLKERACGLVELASVAAVPEDLTVERLVREFGHELELRISRGARARDRGELVEGKTCVRSTLGLRNFVLGLDCLIQLEDLTDFITNEAFLHQVTKQSDFCTALHTFLRDFKANKPDVNCDDVFRAALRRNRDVVNDDKGDVSAVIQGVLNYIIEDTNHGGEGEIETPICDMICGWNHLMLECASCGTIDDRYARFLILELDLPDNDEPVVSLEDCIAGYGLPMALHVESRYSCGRCKRPYDSVIRGIRSVGEVLIMKLNLMNERTLFSGDIRRVEFPDEIDVGTFASEGGVYRIIGVVCREEKHGIDDYTATFLNKSDNQWYLYHRARVFRVSLEETKKRVPYMLFYERIH